jgi:transposase-like protein
MKYKKSINCRKPKGFSQRQHCKYGRKKMTLKTGSSLRRKTRKQNIYTFAHLPE